MVYLSQPLSEFLQDVRDRAVKAKAPPLMIDKLDELASFVEAGDLESQLEKAHDEGYDKAKAEYKDEIDDLTARLEAATNGAGGLQDQLSEAEGKLEHALQQLAKLRTWIRVHGEFTKAVAP